MKDAPSVVQQRLSESNAVRQMVMERCAPQIVDAARIVAAAYRDGKKLLLCGNGGSAADCQHMAAEFVSRLTKELADVAIAVPSAQTQYIQESHLSIEHLICELVERELFSEAYERKV